MLCDRWRRLKPSGQGEQQSLSLHALKVYKQPATTQQNSPGTVEATHPEMGQETWFEKALWS